MCAVLPDSYNELSSLIFSAFPPALVMGNFAMKFLMSETLFKCSILICRAHDMWFTRPVKVMLTYLTLKKICNKVNSDFFSSVIIFLLMFGFCIMRGAKGGERFQSWSQPETNISNSALNVKFAQTEFLC